METKVVTDMVSLNFDEPSVLVIEDNPDYWFFMDKALQQHLPEARTTWKIDARSALDYLDECEKERSTSGIWFPQLIIQNLYLPQLNDGLDLLKALRRRGGVFPQVPILVLSSSTSRDDIAKAYQAGGTSYLVKPESYPQWLAYFKAIRQYWWETVVLPFNVV